MAITKGLFDFATEQEPAPAPQYEQTALFDEPTPAERFAAIKREFESKAEQYAVIKQTQGTMEAISTLEPQEEKKIADKLNKTRDPAYYMADLTAKLNEITLLLERGSRSDAIATVCINARRNAHILFRLTGNDAFSYLVENLNNLAFTLYPQEAQEAAKQKGRSIVFTPEIKDAAGNVITPEQEFILPDELEEYRKNNPVGAAAYEERQPTKADIIKANTFSISFAVDQLKSPGDAILSYDLPVGYYIQYEAAHLTRLAQKVAEMTGGDIEQIIDKDRRTPEQQKALLQLSAQEQMQRMDKFFKSNFAQGLNILEQVQGKYTDKEAEIQKEKEKAVLYFFATHDNIKATDPASLSEQDRSEILAIFTRLDTFYTQNTTGDFERDAKLFFEFISSENKTLAKSELSKFANAEANNALTTVGGRICLITDPEYQDIFTTTANDNAAIGIFRMEENGTKRYLAFNVSTAFLGILTQAARISYLNGNEEIILYMPKISKELGLDLSHLYADNKKVKADTEPEEGAQELDKASSSRSAARYAYFHGVIKEVGNIWGTLPHDVKEYPLFSVKSYDPTTEILRCTSPYLQGAIRALARKEAATINGEKKYYLWHCDLLHTTTANERNQPAVEMAARILVGVQRRGMDADANQGQNKNRKAKGKDKGKDDLVTYHISCKTLIEDCPQIRERLKAQPNASQKTQLLKRTFTAMYRILKTKSDLEEYYADLKIVNKPIPTTRTLDAVITITHHGGNRDYKAPPLPLMNDTAVQEVQEVSTSEP